MDVTTIPPDTCPLCRQRALRWEGATCVCGACGSKFVASARTRRCRYTVVAPEHAALAPALTRGWLTRREVFEVVAQAEAPAGLDAVAAQPSSEGTAQLAEQHEEAPATSAVPGQGSPRPAAPIAAVWAVLIGALAMIPILCACLSALLLGKDVTHTRELIAAANRPTVAISSTLEGQVTSVAGDANKLNPLESPLESPLQQPTALIPEPTATSASPVMPATATPVVVTEQSRPTPPPPTAQFQSPLPTPPAQPGAPATGLPPTFTPLSADQLTATSTPQTTATPEVVTPTSTSAVSVTLTPTPGYTVTATYTGAIRITMVMYTGTAFVNMSDQYVEVANVSSAQASISNWSLTAASSSRSYMFPNGLMLQAGQTCRVYTSSPPQTTGGCGALSFSSPNAVWSTKADTARLYDQNGALMSTYTYATP